MPDINEKYVVYYAVRGYRTGQTVSINIYDSIGNLEITSGSMTELGTTGIYYYNWQPRKRTSYVAVMDCTAYPRKAHQVIRIEKTKVSGAVSIRRVRIPDPAFKEDDKKKIFKLLHNIPTEIPAAEFPKPELTSKTVRNLLTAFKKDILKKIPKPAVFDSKLFQEPLDDFSKKVLSKLSELMLLSDDIQITQRCIPSQKTSSPEEDEIKLVMRHA